MFNKYNQPFLNKFLRKIPADYVDDFHDKHLRKNLLKSLFVDRLVLIFYIPLVILNIMRWQNGDFSRNPIYILVAISHISFFLLYFPYQFIRKNKTEIEK